MLKAMRLHHSVLLVLFTWLLAFQQPLHLNSHDNLVTECQICLALSASKMDNTVPDLSGYLSIADEFIANYCGFVQLTMPYLLSSISSRGPPVIS